jgi:peptide chain release factor 1
MSISDARLAQIGARFAELEARLASGTLEGGGFVAASRDYAELEPVALAAPRSSRCAPNWRALPRCEDDPRCARWPKKSWPQGRPARGRAPLAIAMLPRDSADSRSAMLEIRAGTGGTKPRCSPPTSSACTNAMPPNRAGGSR